MRIRSSFCISIFMSLLFLAFAGKAFSQPVPEKKVPLTRILFLFDASQSMYGQWQSGPKIDIAKKLLSELLDSLNKVENIEIAFRVYGHQKRYPPQDCDDTRLEVPFSKNNIALIKRKLSELQPKGTTPIAASLEECANDFPKTPSRNIIILITDGIEECSGDPCAVSLALQRKGIILKPFVIGMGMDESYMKTFECVGNFYDASNEVTFRNVLNIVISQALNSTSAQVNLLDIYLKPTETNVGMTFYDNFSGAINYNYIHTLNSRGNPDTLSIDPISTYDLVIHTIPPVTKTNIKLNPGKHNIIAVDVPQGFLELKFEALSDYRDLPCIIRKSGEMQTLHVQKFNTTTKYIIGKYDLEVLSLPRLIIKDVDISQSKTTSVQIPKPGMVTLTSNASGYGAIYQEDKNKLTLVCNLSESSLRETFVLLPGTYRVMYRPKNSRETAYTIDKGFKIISGSSIIVNIN